MLEDPRAEGDTPTSGQIRRLGVLEASDEEKNIRKPKWLPTIKSNGAF